MHLSCGKSEGPQSFIVEMGDGAGACCEAVESPAILLILTFCV